ncbi:MAG: phosphotransferase [Patescibacteria group bacterium]|nr:phosphotransferase [Patescibacteria group bacterium]
MKGFRAKENLLVDLSQTEKDFILSTFPEGAVIEESYYFDNYNLPCPIKVKVKTKDKGSKFVVLRKVRHKNSYGIKLEATVLTLLAQYSIPVPKVLAEPKNGMMLLSFLEGENLQLFSMNSKAHAKKAKKLLLEALTTLENITEKISKDAGDELPSYTLMDELNAITEKPPWNSEKIFKEVVDFLTPVLRQISTSLIFTNGDYQPANFLTDGEKIVGFLDFENAKLRDPLMGIAKYPVYDLHPLNKAGFVDTYLTGRNFTEQQFFSRLSLFCLITLQKEISVHPTDKEEKVYQKRVLDLLERSLTGITNSPIN